jgi:hypothetical protein
LARFRHVALDEVAGVPPVIHVHRRLVPIELYEFSCVNSYFIYALFRILKHPLYTSIFFCVHGFAEQKSCLHQIKFCKN